ncbi:hypothetical protein [Deinococcus sp.]|uniref:hypothetical protein n=1 Tax=Deinococcus sp. TaxID=47478 RepID=UPI0025BACB79|nr:hypothetical protein [Deinococcus sp.]
MSVRFKQGLTLGLLALLVGLLGLLLAGPLILMGLSHHTGTPAHVPWPGPAGTRWAGTELQGMEKLGRNTLLEEYLELRCVARPSLNTRLDYWPGAGSAWDGWLEWRADKVVYVPYKGQEARPRRLLPAIIPAPDWLGGCSQA